MKVPTDILPEISTARNVVALTGAGISAESGIPTFRGTDGIWNKLKPEELADFGAFLRNPELVSEWYKHRRQVTRVAKPNGAHLALVEMATLFPIFAVITQNIDNLHERAGSETVIELHGNIERNYCLGCGKRYDGEEFDKNGSFKCNECGGLIRPDIVWFGEMLPTDQWNAAEAAASEADIMFVVGTSAVVYPAANLPMTVKRNSGKIVEINTEETPLSEFADVSIQGPASEVLSEIVNGIKEFRRDAKK
ncbi:MAG: NAD-dependent deacylase [Bacteroidetes bacterium]|nr:NAD-dependent deacylase [Bacteroidota bacterium]MCL5267907.1 NAD-dependent deacylase [Bacteroidota bacterium]